MSGPILSKILWLISAVALGAGAPQVQGAEAPTIRLYHSFEAQIFCLQGTAAEVEVLVINGGRVDRRAVGHPSAAFIQALATLEEQAKSGGAQSNAPRPSRAALGGTNFYYLTHPSFNRAGRGTGSGATATLLTAARQLAGRLPPKDVSGLYVLAVPGEAPGPQEQVFKSTALPEGSPVWTAMSSLPFPVRITDPKALALLPRDSAYSVQGRDGAIFLLSYFEGAPFSLSDWLKGESDK